MLEFDPLDLVTPSRYGENGRPHALFARMRREAPVLHCAPEGYKPFFALTGHFCIGAALARMEIKVLLEELVPRLQTLELAGEARYMHSNFINGPKALPIEVTLDPSGAGR